MTLVILAGLVAVVASVANNQRVAFRSQISRQQRERAHLAALAGIQRAIAVLATIPAPGQSGQTTTTTGNTTSQSGAITLQDDWATLGQTGSEKFIVGNASFRLQIVDASSFVNINSATEDQWNKLPLAPEEIASILDYRTTGSAARPLGAKDDYYNALAEPYNAKLANFETVDELLQVKGLTAKILYELRTDVQTSNPLPTDINGNTVPLADLLTAVSYSARLNPQGQALINVGGAAGAANRRQRLQALGFSANFLNQIAPAQGPQPTFATVGAICARASSADDLAKVLDNLATDAQPRQLGRININTAPESVLQTVPGITPDLATAIVQRQTQGFASLGEVTQVPGITSQVLSQCADLLTASSQTFYVRIVGTSGQTSVAVLALIDVENGTPKLLMVQDQPFNDMITRWNWPTDTNVDTTLKEAA
ncbi:general secretion pathway protein K [Fimbriimonas ginsengisoli Gsoil 348]|uniref:General secretion pathway protein K n=1 Tax=Fimbriimonas ginsengisoli Gsoil 348 TaxID=661478 RepID=A0A068NXT8_FIMGI|nr:general secretion pathway protein K [Fimbriimonas ginsengisoli Gsoil 348]